ncbi:MULTISPECIES: S24 family peptidase [Acinetobacter]|uniref:Helix-turn-helix transcriptional regulator n=1 Tax=Acinetobacter piscicola TaxID=2006115 RepID=A0A7S7AHU0_9GAMM|nr:MULTISPECIES: S24 family peptidase [Acinetobacter]QOW46477.1 helix-turn-helix transcriptional regulator [Acinetobacter piscicola]
MVGLTVGDRVRQCRKQKGWSQIKLAKEAQVTQATISHIENNSSDQSKFLPQLAKALSVSVDFLLSGQEYIDRKKGNLDDFIVVNGGKKGQAPNSDEYVLIPKFDVAGSCGSGSIIDHVDVDGGLVFSENWIKSQNLNIEKLVVIHAIGDSMYPSVEDGQVLLVDTSDTIPKNSKIYFLCIDGEYYIKRLINMITHWVIRSDNPDKNQYPDIEISSDKIHAIQIEGRVCWKGGTL